MWPYPSREQFHRKKVGWSLLGQHEKTWGITERQMNSQIQKAAYVDGWDCEVEVNHTLDGVGWDISWVHGREFFYFACLGDGGSWRGWS